tara:strand:- start:186 stop:1289 length:1104 start_codon:yes stop_codon:yes gene_type:complete
MKIPIAKPNSELSDIKNFESRFIKEVHKGIYIGGENVKSYEEDLKNFLNVKYVASLNSGTDALVLSLFSMGIKPGDEIILPSFTYFATAEAVMHVGAIPVFADVEKNSYCISANTVEKLITKKTRCIIPVHLYGYDSDIENIVKLAKKNNISILEDVAQAFGSKSTSNKYLGAYGDIGAFSNYPSKTLGGIGDGGFIATNNYKLYKKISLLKNHGQSSTYQHEIMGVNSRLDSLNAFVLRNKLKNFNKISKTRSRFVNFYLDFFNTIDTISVPRIHKNLVLNYFSVQFLNQNRNTVKKSLQDEGIQTSIFYQKPLHKQPALIKYGFRDKGLKNTDTLSKNILSLPLYSNPTDVELRYIHEKLAKIVK